LEEEYVKKKYRYYPEQQHCLAYNCGGWKIINQITFCINFLCPRNEESGGHINLPLSVRLSIRPFVRPNIDTWFVRLSPPTVLELQL